MKHFEKEFESIRQNIITMGSEVEKQLSMVIDSLINGNEENAEKVIANDERIDAMEIDNDNFSITLFAKFQPTAFDLRFIASVIKINNDFERIGDQAVNIAKKALYILPRPELHINITPMALLAKEMVHLSVDSLIRDDTGFAEKILAKEKEMDEYQIEYTQQIVHIMKEDPKNIKRALNVLLMIRCFERIGDLATNVAEDIIYYVKAKDIRHSGGLKE